MHLQTSIFHVDTGSIPVYVQDHQADLIGSPHSPYKVSPDWRPPLRFNKRTNSRNNGP